MPTAVVFILVNGKRYLAHVFLNNGAETCLIVRSFVKRTNVIVHLAKEIISLACIIDGLKILDTSASLLLKSRFLDYQIVISAEVVDRILYKISNEIPKIVELPQISNLLSMNFHTMISILSMFLTQPILVCLLTTYCDLARVNINCQFEKFWEIEEGKSELSLLPEITIHKNHFKKTYTHDNFSRFIIHLPTKPTIKPLEIVEETNILSANKCIDLSLEINSIYKSSHQQCNYCAV
ncbi:hypothetical protein PGB90_001010 [Kerria lacca]